jgi:hypothetical protein
MKLNQEHTPKYWVFHDTNSDDVLLATADKSLDRCADKAELLYPALYEDWLYENAGSFAISLFELNLLPEK